MRIGSLLVVAAALASCPAWARDYCPDRPGLDTPPCTVEPGRASAETSLGDWTHWVDPATVTDTVLIGDLTLRVGIADHAEVRIAWAAFGHSRSRDRLTGAVDVQSGSGDVTIGIKRNLIDPDSKGFSVAVLPSITLPTGGPAIGAGDWAAGLQVPVSIPLTGRLSLVFTPELDATVDDDRAGRHLVYGTAGGLAFALLDGVNIAVESEAMHSDDPAGASTAAAAGVAVGILLGAGTQIDVGSEFGLSHAAPNSHFYVGLARRF